MSKLETLLSLTLLVSPIYGDNYHHTETKPKYSNTLSQAHSDSNQKNRLFIQSVVDYNKRSKVVEELKNDLEWPEGLVRFEYRHSDDCRVKPGVDNRKSFAKLRQVDESGFEFYNLLLYQPFFDGKIIRSYEDAKSFVAHEFQHAKQRRNGLGNFLETKLIDLASHSRQAYRRARKSIKELDCYVVQSKFFKLSKSARSHVNIMIEDHKRILTTEFDNELAKEVIDHILNVRYK